MQPVSLVLVDFDDTLVDTAPRFQNARRSLFSVLAGLGAPVELAQRVHHEQIDPLMLLRHGLGPARLAHSFRATYETVCAELSLPVDLTVAEQCAQLGSTVAGTPPQIAGALAALQRLRVRHRTVVYTQSGDTEYQRRCVHETGVAAIVGEHAVRICERKTVTSFLDTLSTLNVADPGSVWMIGNSIRSDVNPALQAGARAILVETAEPWEFDQVEPFHSDFIRVNSFAAAVDYLLNQDP